MTTCRSWCGKVDYHGWLTESRASLEPIDGYAGIDAYGTHYCSQSCLDRATAKPATCGVVIAGVPCKLPEGHVFTNGHGVATTAPERKLAKGWEIKQQPGWTYCDSKPSHRGYVYSNFEMGMAACEDHAAELGVFETESVNMVNVGRGVADQLRELFPGPKCPICTHRHVGKPCNGTSPNGEYSCPCGNLTDESAKQASSGLYAVGKYARQGVAYDAGITVLMKRDDRERGVTATLLANLERERVPGRRPIRTVRWYEGNGDE